MSTGLLNKLRWFFGRVWIIYVVIIIFSATFLDLKSIDTRLKIRRLNDAIPDFSFMIMDEKDENKSKIDWRPYKKYFKLVLKYMPFDILTRQLLAYVEAMSGQEQKAIELFKNSSEIQGHALFWADYNLGVIYYKRQMWPQAANYLFKAVTASPQLAMLLMHNSMVYHQIFSNPAFVYSIDTQMKEALADSYFLLLSSLFQMGAYDKMLMIDNAGLSNPQLGRREAFYYYAGLGFYGMGQLQKAYNYFQQNIVLDPNNAGAYYYMADIFQKTGQLEQAKKFLEASYMLRKNSKYAPYDKARLRFF